MFYFNVPIGKSLFATLLILAIAASFLQENAEITPTEMLDM
ncbi:MAG: hypothetical protein ACI9TY_001371 [Alphaproteobacteria bacterium]|jgi:hypothetical protein